VTPRLLAASFLCAAIAALPAPAAADPAASMCAAPTGVARFTLPLVKVAQRLAERAPLTIVAIGSSSTAGAGASSSAASYPSRLEAALKARFPQLEIKVLNRGINGEEIPQMLARLDTAVLAEKPDLVLWQLGTNSVLRDHDISTHDALIREGIERIKAAGADVLLMDPQYAPAVVAKPDVHRMLDLIASTAKAQNVDLFHRFAVMRYWHEAERVGFEEFLAPDGLHLNDWSYDCVAKLLAAQIAEAAIRAPVTARAPVARR
jgi:acyl-CoA thioesterase-1